MLVVMKSDATEADIARVLPVTVEAREVLLLAETEPSMERWQTRARLPLARP